MEVGLGVGSNLGDRLENLRAARASIAALAGVRVAAVSPVYETEPVGVKPEFADLAYLNAVLVVDTGRAVEDLHAALAAIEHRLGRIRGEDRFAPRTIDIDILYAGGLVRDTDRLALPHPRWAARRFVVQPLADVRPDLIVPGMPGTVADTLSRLPAEPAVTLFLREW